MVLCFRINNAKQAIGSTKSCYRFNKTICFKKNSELLKQGSIEIAKESERATADIETLQKTNRDIIETLDQVIQIHEKR